MVISLIDTSTEENQLCSWVVIQFAFFCNKNKNRKGNSMKRDKIACNCENVTYGQIIDAVNGGAKTFEEVSEITGCSTGCGGCREFIEVFVRDLVMFPEDQE